ncbi:DUF389 domain-containing protein [Halogeometricum sp. S1BR25-6]|uniref:DUF389 domain-containing protein n=1 Tax=Halogeometricum salsisoli TaxID=2950536 RepID=A0ABU2GDP7_9EURY|nr:DUF389 domain-containing protein [Halogeometricum sp. S1BR25-6]MDS0298931.1 DUF389 domain-containing protein [Halogeometricum sp. S1BR25-6]
MRELHLSVSADKRDEVVPVLDDNDIDYVTIPRDGDETFFMLPVPTAAVSTVLEGLEEADVDEESYTVVTKAETVEMSQYEGLRERYSATVRKLSKEELHAKVREMQWPYQIYYVGTVLSVLAAAAGLLLDQPALIIGAMIIAPQASSALAAPAGALLNDWEMFVASVREQFLSLGIAIAGATVFGVFLQWAGFVPATLEPSQIELVGVRLAPTFLSTTGAVIAGIVGAFGYTTEQSTAIIGVMIAAALIPSAAAAGLGIAWASPLLATGAFLLLLVNILAINLGVFVTLRVMGYVPDWREESESFRKSISPDNRMAVYGTLLVLLVSLVATGYLTGASVAFARSVNQEVEATFEQPEYANLSLSGVQVGYVGTSLEREPTSITVMVGRTSNHSYPDLAGRLERQVERATGRNVAVTVEFTEVRSSNRTRPPNPATA